MKAHFLTNRTIENNNRGTANGPDADGNQGTIHPIVEWSKKFLTDRRAQGLSLGTCEFYAKKFLYLFSYCERNKLVNIEDLTADHIRKLMVELEQSNHNAAGIATVFRTVRTFLYWYEREEEPEGWRNPIRKVKAPKIPTEPLEPVELEEVKKILAVCSPDFTGDRDRAIVLTLLDTGCRASELCNMNTADVDINVGSILIRQGKGRKPRTVFVGTKTKKALRQYIKQKPQDARSLFITVNGNKFSYSGLVEVIRRRCMLANMRRVSLHSFRRAFALQCLRNGMDIFTLQRLMGHADIQILRRYLAQTDSDSERGHRGYGPVDNSDW